jgi:hypothetical protein
LHLIKILRQKGYSVAVTPDNGTKLNYITEKGFREFLADPVIALVMGIPIGVLANLLSSWIYDKLKHRPDGNDVNLVLQQIETGKLSYYNYGGAIVKAQRVKDLLQLQKQRVEIYTQSEKQLPPHPNLTIPIHLEHTGKIVGWAEGLKEDEKGLAIEGGHITDPETLHRI